MYEKVKIVSIKEDAMVSNNTVSKAIKVGFKIDDSLHHIEGEMYLDFKDYKSCSIDEIRRIIGEKLLELLIKE